MESQTWSLCCTAHWRCWANSTGSMENIKYVRIHEGIFIIELWILRINCIYNCHTKVVRNMSVMRPKITRKHGLTNYIWSLQQSILEVRFHLRFKWGICVCNKIRPANMYLYCNLSRNWRWHYMGSTWVGPWNCLCKAIVLPHIRITWGLHWSAHGTFCHTLSLHGVYIGRLMKLLIWTTVLPHIGITWGLLWLAHGPLAKYVKLWVRMRRECRERFPRHRG